jgi:NAD(P)-dependent dehydrogenase (short-subunit alcohol dehydrogenase family)
MSAIPPSTSLSELGLAIVAGAQGGIGAALLQVLERSEQCARVVGLSRHVTPAFDLLDEASIRHRTQAVQSDGLLLRLVIDATGFLHNETWSPERSWQ